MKAKLCEKNSFVARQRGPRQRSRASLRRNNEWSGRWICVGPDLKSHLQQHTQLPSPENLLFPLRFPISAHPLAMSQVAVWRGPKLGLFGYWHHGILCPDGSVIHYSTGSGKRRSKRRARVIRTSLEQFRKDSTAVYEVHPKDLSSLLPLDEVVRRAESRLGNGGYHLLFNNCESFAKWCATGEEKSRQINSHAKYVLHGFFPFGVPGAVLGACLSAMKMSFGDLKTCRMIRKC